MSAIAKILHEQGHTVTGSDRQESTNTLRLRESGIKVSIGHSPKNVDGADIVVYNAAIKPDNPELAEAIKRGIPTMERPVALGHIMEPYKHRVGVAGTHGKTTTTSMIGSILDYAAIDATVLFGSDMKSAGGNVRIGDGSVIVTEACEAFGSFLHLKPSISVITNIEADHLDYYKTIDAVERAFCQFVDDSDEVVACSDEPRVRKILDGCKKKVIWYGTTGSPDLLATDIEINKPKPTYTLVRGGNTLGSVTIGVPGIQNVLDSLAAAGVAFEISVSFDAIQGGLAEFSGTGRRFEVLYNDGNIMVVDDYAHHPTEIKATLSGARKAYPGRRIIAVFQPHLYSRTHDFCAQFAESLSLADHVVITSIYAARELPMEGVSAENIVDRMHIDGYVNVNYFPDKGTIADELADKLKSGDMVIVLGAGDVRTVGESLAEQLSSRSAS